MNTLNLARINELAPYEVWQTSEGDFNFQTGFGVLYRISFRLEQTFNKPPPVAAAPVHDSVDFLLEYLHYSKILRIFALDHWHMPQ